MSLCSPSVSIARDIRTSDFTAVSVQLEQDAPTQWWPVCAEVVQLSGVTEGMLQGAVIRQLHLLETASAAANVKKNDIRIVVYSHSGTTVPTEGAVYNPSPTNRIGIIDVVAADYKRISDTEWLAVPIINSGEGLHYKTNSSAPATELYCVLLFSAVAPSAYTNATANIALNAFVENCQYTG